MSPAEPSETRTSVPRSSTVGTVVHIVIGPVIWAAHLMVIYASQSALCARSLAAPVPVVVIAATMVAAAGLVLAAALPSRVAILFRASDWPAPRQRFNNHLSVVLAVLSLLAVCAEGATAILVASCGALR